jgi:multiple sugar transport system permease protein
MPMQPRLLQYLLILPVQILLVGIILIPSIYVGWLSFQQSSFGTDTVFVGLANYIRLATDPFFWRSVINTFIVVNVVVYAELLLGLAMASFFADDMPFKRVVISIVIAPYAVSEVIAVLIWRYMFEPDIGLAQWLLDTLHLPSVDWTTSPTQALALVCVISVWQHLPFTFLILYSSRLGIPNELYEAAYLDGATEWQMFLRITLPLLKPAILIALLFRYIFAFRIFSEVWLLTGGGPARTTETVATYLFRTAFRYSEFGLASATGWAVVLLSLLFSLYYLRLVYKGMFANA